jgi:three-Cys-motif partner protein
MSSVEFFTEQKEQSKVKTEIVTKYFDAWSNIMSLRAGAMNYIDLFSGPGRYEDGSESTPLLILKKCIENEKLRSSVATIFNDANSEIAARLQAEIDAIDGIEELSHTPNVLNTEIGEEVVEVFRRKRMSPTLTFIDPFGYKGLTSELIGALIKDWGSDCIFFFNYNRINMGIRNPIVEKHMNAIFGEERAEALRERVINLSPEERELTIVNELAQSLSNGNANYVLPFRFMDENKNKTSHYLIFVSKHILGYTIMKEIMWKSSTSYEDNVASFSYIPVKHLPQQSYEQLELLLGYSRPLDDLGTELRDIFKGQTLTVEKIIDKHHVSKPFIAANYKETLRRLEEDGYILANPPAAKRRMYKGIKTMGDNVVITFLR